MRSKPLIVTSVKTDERITELHLWAVHEGLRRTPTATLFEDFCRRLVAAGVPVWRAFVGMRTLHPQWAGYTYTWWRDRNEVDPTRRERGEVYERDIRDSPYAYLRDVAAGRDLPLRLRRRLTGSEAQRDFPFLEELANSGATDYIAELIPVGMVTEAFPDNGIGFSFATDHPEGFGENDLRLIEAVLPAVALAIMSDATPGPVLVEMLDDIFETLIAPLRPHGAQVLKFLGDGMLASFPFVDATRDETCGRALDAAAEAMHNLDRLNADRAQMSKPIATVDLALHLGEVLYGNVGAVDRLDFTVIGPAVNEVARIETLCEPLDRKVLISAALATVIRDRTRLEPLGAHALRGVREAKEIFALRF